MRTLRRIPFFLLGFIFTPLAAHAAVFNNINELVARICYLANWLFTFLVLIAVIFILYAAFLYIVGGADPAKVKQAHLTIVYAAVGLGVAILTKAFPYVIASFFGIPNWGRVC